MKNACSPASTRRRTDMMESCQAPWWSVPVLLYALFFLFYELFALAEQDYGLCKYRDVLLVRTTPMLKSRVRFLPQSGRSRSTIPDDSRRSPMLNLRYQELGQCATWINGSTDTSFYPHILPNYHGARKLRKVRSTCLRQLHLEPCRQC
jgi:hypothetical protein